MFDVELSIKCSISKGGLTVHHNRINHFSIGLAALACLLCGVALLACVGLVSCGGGASTSGSSSSAEASYRHVSVEEVEELIKEPNVIMADVRGEGDYDAGHIPEAICVPYSKIEAGEAASFLPNKNQLVIVCSDDGSVSKKTAEKLVSEGYTNVVEFDGLKDWKGKLEVEACC